MLQRTDIEGFAKINKLNSSWQGKTRKLLLPSREEIKKLKKVTNLSKAHNQRTTGR